MRYAELIKTIVGPFVKYPEHIAVEEAPWKDYLNITMRVHAADQSKVIGGGSKMVKSITSLIMAAGRRLGDKINFEILEPITGQREVELSFHDDPNWTEDKSKEMLGKMFRIFDLILHTYDLEVRESNHLTFIYLSYGETISVEVLAALNAVFRAIGKAHGRRISLHIGEPHTAAGNTRSR